MNKDKIVIRTKGSDNLVLSPKQSGTVNQNANVINNNVTVINKYGPAITVKKATPKRITVKAVKKEEQNEEVSLAQNNTEDVVEAEKQGSIDKVKKDGNASRIFVERYKPTEQNLDFNRLRIKNLKELNAIIDKIENLEMSFAQAKTEAYKEAYNNSDKSDKALEQIEKDLEKEFDQAIANDKEALRLELIKVINRQARFMTVIKNPKDVYEYYKMIFEMPLEGEYHELEARLYHEFLLRHPEIQNIIISYSELEQEKERNKKSNDKKKDDDDKKKKKDDDKKKKNLDDLTDDEKAALKAVELVEKKANAKIISDDMAELVVDAFNKINKLENSEFKKSLEDRMNEVTIKLAKKFIEDLGFIMENITKNPNYDIDYALMASLRNTFDAIRKDEVKEADFSKLKYGNAFNDLINVYNNQAQDSYKKNVKLTDKNLKPYSLKNLFIEQKTNGLAFVIRKLASPMSDYCYKLYKKAVNKGNKEKARKYEAVLDRCQEKLAESEIVGSVRLFCARNKLAKLKPTLYKSGVSALDEKQRNSYDKAVKTIEGTMHKKLSKFASNKNIVSDKIRVKTVIGQYLSLLAMSTKATRKNLIFNELVNLIEKAYRFGSITLEQRDAYMDEIDNITYYRDSKNNEYYEIPYDNLTLSYNELDGKMVGYHRSPVCYTDEDYVESIKYIKEK